MTTRCTFNVRVPLRDGVELSADVYLPHTPQTAPTLLARTPYNKNSKFAYEKASWFAHRGYGFVWMDVRGRGDSDGTFVPYRNDGPDGYDAVEWVASQNWSTGRVGTWGQSYLGCIQWLTALERPPHLTAMVVYVTPSDPFVEHPTGVRLPMTLCWYRMLDGRLLQYVEGVDWRSIYGHRPLLTMDERAGFCSTHWRDDISHPPSDKKYWDPLSYQRRLGELDIPVLHVTGWYDDVQPGTFGNFIRMSTGASSARGRRSQRLVVGPWDHQLTAQRSRKLGNIDFGPEAEFDLDTFELGFLDHHLRETANTVEDEPPVRLFVMGANQWREEREWPLARTSWTEYFLSSGGDANTRHGGGALAREQAPQNDEPCDSYRYDPDNPVPFLTEPLSAQIGGPDDYAEVEERSDVLVYSTLPLTKPIEVTGPIRLVLYASSSAVDTDFTAKLVDVHPDGFCQRLCDGVARARFRDGMDREVLMEPGRVYEFTVDLWNTSQLFREGHRIRLEVASSAFPKYDCNPNTGEPIVSAVAAQIAENRVWHTTRFPSHLVLPEIHEASLGTESA